MSGTSLKTFYRLSTWVSSSFPTIFSNISAILCREFLDKKQKISEQSSLLSAFVLSFDFLSLVGDYILFFFKFTWSFFLENHPRPSEKMFVAQMSPRPWKNLDRLLFIRFLLSYHANLPFFLWVSVFVLEAIIIDTQKKGKKEKREKDCFFYLHLFQNTEHSSMNTSIP